MVEPQGAKPDAVIAPPGEAASPEQVPQAQASPSRPSVEPIEAVATGDLPLVDAPKLAAEAVVAPGTKAVNAEPNKAGGEPPAAAMSAPPARFAPLAASIGVAAALGSFVGSLFAAGVVHVWSAAPLPVAAAASALASDSQQALKAELAELSALRASVDGAARSANSQFAKISERLDRAALDPAAKIAHIADTVDKLEKRSGAAPETTGAIANSQPSLPTADEKRPILHDWIVRDVRGNRALVESRYGGIFAIAAGGMHPRLGRVEAIKRQDGQWVVVTERGVITSGQ